MAKHNFWEIVENAHLPNSGKGFSIPGTGYLVAWGTSVPADAATGYATGCLYFKTDGGAGTSLYVNEGSTTSADFNALAGA